MKTTHIFNGQRQILLFAKIWDFPFPFFFKFCLFWLGPKLVMEKSETFCVQYVERNTVFIKNIFFPKSYFLL